MHWLTDSATDRALSVDDKLNKSRGLLYGQLYWTRQSAIENNIAGMMTFMTDRMTDERDINNSDIQYYQILLILCTVMAAIAAVFAARLFSRRRRLMRIYYNNKESDTKSTDSGSDSSYVNAMNKLNKLIVLGGIVMLIALVATVGVQVFEVMQTQKMDEAFEDWVLAEKDMNVRCSLE